QEVKAGDPPSTIDPRPNEGTLRDGQADLARDQAQLVVARLEFEREKKLLESSIASKDDYDKAEAAFHALEATVLADQSAISYAVFSLKKKTIRTPTEDQNGNLLLKQRNVLKAPDAKLVTINQVHPLYVTFSVTE